MKFFLFLLITCQSFAQLSPHVAILDTAFPAPQLHTTKKIWTYLPAAYAKDKTRYPVIYMPDGGHVFDSHACSDEAWSVDECLDSLISNGKPAAIVIAIEGDTTVERTTGENYLDFLVKELKPFVDRHYRTLSSKEYTIIAGSCLGGLMAYNAMLVHPECFGKTGIFSPLFDSAHAVNELTDSAAAKLTGKYFFYTGGQEGDIAVNYTEAVREKIGKNSDATIYAVIDPGGGQNAQAWRKWFAEFYGWIMADGFNNMIRVEK